MPFDVKPPSWRVRDAPGFPFLGCLKYETFANVRPILFHPGARAAIRRFPKEVRTGLGRHLFQLQLGEQLAMPHSRAMPSVAAGVSELRVQGEDGAYRAFYFTLSREGILVFHAFVKKTRQTPAQKL